MYVSTLSDHISLCIHLHPFPNLQPEEFGSSLKLTSFTRRLSRWGFQQCRIPDHAQFLAFFHPDFRRGDREAAKAIKSVQAEQGMANAQASRERFGQQFASKTQRLVEEERRMQLEQALAEQQQQRQLQLLQLEELDPFVAARLRAAAAFEVEEETNRIRQLEQKLLLQQAEAQAAQGHPPAAYGGNVGSDLKSLAARTAASALTRRYSGTGASLGLASELGLTGARPPGLGPTATSGPSLAEMHYAQMGSPPLATELLRQQQAQQAQTQAQVLAQAQAQAQAQAHGAADLSECPPSIFGDSAQAYESCSPLEREFMLQARYKHLLNIQASLQRKALLGSQDQQYLQAQEQQQAQLMGIGAGTGAAGISGRLLPQADVDTATRNVLAGASAVIERDSLLSPGRPTF